MKYKLTATERAERLEDRAKAREEKAARRQTLTDWFDARRDLATKRKAERAKAPKAPRGVARVPARYQVTRPAPEVLVQLEPQPRRRSRKVRLREQRSARVEYAVGEALKGREFVTDEGEQAAAAAVRRWVR